MASALVESTATRMETTFGASDVALGSPEGREPPSAAGRFSPCLLLKLLRDVFVGRRTGLLWLSNGDSDVKLSFTQGHLVDASSGSEMQPGRGLDEVRGALSSVLMWDAGSYVFEVREVGSVPDPGWSGALSTGQFILDAVRAVRDADALLATLGELDCPLVLSSDPLLRIQNVSLSATDGYILSRVDGTLSCRDVVSLSPLPADEAYRSLAGLLATGMLEVGQRAQKRESAASRVLRHAIIDAYAGLYSKDDWEVLGLARDSSPADVRDAYRAAVRRFHPDALHDAGLSGLKLQAAAVFERVSKAHETLSKPRPAPPAQPSNDLPEVQAPPEIPLDAAGIAEALKEAEARLVDGQPLDAIAILHRVLPVSEAAVKQRVQIALARACMMCPDRTRQAEELLLEAARDDPGNADVCFALGTFYKQRGLPARAKAMFRKVLELRPGHAPAKAELATLQPVSEAPGLLSRFRKRP